ncbi:MAG TPA: type I pullulanase [Bacilli bacterium]|nr:type I pullulanase [Bacilli bacterium]
MRKFLTKLLFAGGLLLGATAFLRPVQQAEAIRPPVTKSEVVRTSLDPNKVYAEKTLVFHLHLQGKDGDAGYDPYDLWIWGENQGGVAHDFLYWDGYYGAALFVPLSNYHDQTQINIILRPGNKTWEGQGPDINLKIADYIYDETTNAVHFYLLNRRPNVYRTADDAMDDQVYTAEFSAEKSIRVSTNYEPASYNVKKDNDSVISGQASGASYSAANFEWITNINLGASHNTDLLSKYEVEITFKDSGKTATALVSLDGLFDTPFFISQMTYDGDDLGVTYTPTKTTIKAWAPTSLNLKLRLFDNGTPEQVSASKGSDVYTEHNFVRGTKGVWTVELDGDMHGKYYTFMNSLPTGEIELVDPYAKAAGVNGVRGMIVDFSKTNPTGWDAVNYSVKKQTEIVPYELHVADLTADSTWTGSESNRMLYGGLIESGTTYTKGGVTVKTGYDHILELGINALQILPFYDQENDEVNKSFNWGYNPKNFNVLEGSYSADPYDGLVRIREFKNVVKAYASHDIRIIMDVVYNHVASMSAHSFSKLVPNYYFRLRPDGSPDNSSGVGNVTASERIMMENFMRDSAAFWVDEYKIGGFRYDLMGLHTTKSMNAVMNKVKQIRPDIIVYGEAWDMNQLAGVPELATQANVYKVPGVGAFNDQVRDAIMPNSNARGWLQMSKNQLESNVTMRRRITDALLGKLTGGPSDPVQVINYVACHDNHTLYDRVVQAGAGDFDLDRLMAQSVQADSLVLLSQGVSFIHAGSEILRSKPLPGGGFDHNSYKSSYEINSIKWDEKVTNLAAFNNYVELINLKRDSAAFNYNTRAAIDANVSVKFGDEVGFGNNVIKMTTKDAKDSYVVYFVGSTTRENITDLTGLEIVLDTSGTLEPGTIVDGRIRVGSNTTIVAKVHRPGSEDPVDPSDPDDTSSEPGTSEPGISEPGTTEPGTSEPGASEPTTSTPSTGDDDKTEPKRGCGGTIATSISLSFVLLLSLGALQSKRRKLK